MNRYQRDKLRKERQERHARIIGELSGDIIEDFKYAEGKMGDDLLCRQTEEYPNPWYDWDRYPDRAEPHEGDIPTKEEAVALCAGCPLYDEDDRKNICLNYALATRKDHGVWGGQRFYGGRRVKMEIDPRSAKNQNDSGGVDG